MPTDEIVAMLKTLNINDYICSHCAREGGIYRKITCVTGGCNCCGEYRRRIARIEQWCVTKEKNNAN